MISIIIPTYNHRVALEKCLASIARETYRDYEVIIVDDGSNDGTKEWLEQWEHNPIFKPPPCLAGRQVAPPLPALSLSNGQGGEGGGSRGGEEGLKT